MKPAPYAVSTVDRTLPLALDNGRSGFSDPQGALDRSAYRALGGGIAVEATG